MVRPREQELDLIDSLLTTGATDQRAAVSESVWVCRMCERAPKLLEMLEQLYSEAGEKPLRGIEKVMNFDIS